MINFSNSKNTNVSQVKDFYCNYATWKVTDKYDDWQKIIEKSSCIVTALDNDNLIGMARGLSDEVRWATIIDVLVHPNYRGNAIGKQLIMNLLNQKEMKVRTIYLATPDKESFYNKLGFKTANEHCSYMIKLSKENEENYFLPIDK